MRPLLEVEGLVKTYSPQGRSTRPATRAVDHLGFSVVAGETLGIVGESGSGKTTVGRMILGMQRPDRGDIRFEGRSVVGLRGSARRQWLRTAQMVFQDPYSTLPHHMTIARIVEDPFRIHRVPGFERPDVAELLEDVGLPRSYLTRHPHELSGGERQRVVIARALALRPRLVVCDEAVSALDVSVQGKVLDLLRRLQEQHHLTYLFISHDLGVVRRVCDRVCVMQSGRIVEQGPVDHVYDDPQHDYTKALLSAVPVASRFGRYRHRSD